jgi:SAM-dependent methyltransferase
MLAVSFFSCCIDARNFHSKLLSMTFSHEDWQQLQHLRAQFLDRRAGHLDYWTTPRVLELYEHTFAQRIAWKWQHVLAELLQLRWQPPALPLLDWGCGTGIAARTFLRYFHSSSVTLYDRSTLALKFAQEKIRSEFPHITLLPFDERTSFCGVVLLSHIITELSDSALDALLTQLRFAAAILWVESGDRYASRKLIEVREALRASFHIVAPCTHQGACGLLLPEHRAHWCHHFAKPPQEAFTQARWADFKAHLGIDLSDLPLSYLVLDKHPIHALSSDTARLIGRARLYKGYALLLACSAHALEEYRLTARKFPEAYRQMKKQEFHTLFSMQSQQREITRLEPVHVSPSDDKA